MKVTDFKKITGTVTITIKCALLKALFSCVLLPCHFVGIHFI